MSVALLMRAALDRRRWRYGALTLLAAFPTAMVLLATGRGPGVSPDSVVYASTANAFASTGDLTNFFGKPLTIFPPGFPIALGLAQRAGMDQQTASIALDLLCVALCILLTYLLASALLDSRPLALLSAAIVSFSVATVRVFSMMWTEPLFALLCLLVLCLLARMARRQDTAWWQILALCVAVSAACSLRFVGLTLIPIAALGVLLAKRTQGWLRAGSTAALTLVLSSLGFAMVGARNHSLGVPVLGERNASGMSVGSVIHDSIKTIGGYVLPESALPATLGPLVFVLGLLVIAVLAYATYRAIRQSAAAVSLMALFIGVYWIAIAYSEVAATLDPVNERFSSPVFAPMVVLVMFGCRELARDLRSAGAGEHASAHPGTTARILAGLTAIALGFCVTISIYASASFVRRAAEHGLDFNERSSLDSPLTQALLTLAAGSVVASTNPWRVYWNTHHTPLRLIPVTARERTSGSAEPLVNAIRSGQVQYLAYFNDDITAVSPQSLAEQGIQLTRVRSEPDGELYAVGSKARSTG